MLLHTKTSRVQPILFSYQVLIAHPSHSRGDYVG